jgi:hypothetical protein
MAVVVEMMMVAEVVVEEAVVSNLVEEAAEMVVEEAAEMVMEAVVVVAEMVMEAVVAEVVEMFLVVVTVAEVVAMFLVVVAVAMFLVVAEVVAMFLVMEMVMVAEAMVAEAVVVEAEVAMEEEREASSVFQASAKPNRPPPRSLSHSSPMRTPLQHYSIAAPKIICWEFLTERSTPAKLKRPLLCVFFPNMPPSTMYRPVHSLRSSPEPTTATRPPYFSSASLRSQL